MTGCAARCSPWAPSRFCRSISGREWAAGCWPPPGRRAKALGFQAILLLGDPAYYGRQGFRPAEELGIRTADGCYADALQVCVLTEGALSGAAGRYLEDPIYEVDLDAAADFDRQFPPKEPLADTPAQLRFREVAGRRRKAE